MSVPTLDLRALNRATLARQLLLERHDLPPLAAVARLGGLQAQLARPPFVGLWTRLRDFRRDALLALARERRVVRATMMRATLHLVTADEYRALRPALQPALSAALSVLGARVKGLDTERLACAARERIGDGALTFDEIRAHLAAVLPGADERAMGYVVRLCVPLVQVPAEESAWGWDPQPAFALAERWLGAPLGEGGGAEAVVRRHLAAFGPATPADTMAWSGMRGLRATFEAMRPELVTVRDARGRELFDLPDAPRPGGDVPAPVRFLPEFDSLVLAHDDRSRVVPDAYRARIVSKNLQVAATFLVDGMVAGTWKVARRRGTAVLAVQPFGTLASRVRRELEEEGLRLLAFAEPDARAHEVEFTQEVAR